jgi:hypothetical protein
MQWLKHAFAIDPPGPAQPDPAERILVDRICSEVVRRRLTTPALLLLEMSRPLNYVSAQVLHFLQPFLSALGSTADAERFARFLERRGSIEYIADRIEALDAEGRPQPPASSNQLPPPTA